MLSILRGTRGTDRQVNSISSCGRASGRKPSLVALGAACLVLAVRLTAGFDGGRRGDRDKAKAPGEVYLYACVVCHAAEGKGASRTVVGFDQALPDFTDANFASREPDTDWEAIIHLGGPARGFSRLMPAFGTVLTDEEIGSAVKHLRTFSDSTSWPRGELNFPRAFFTEKAYPEDELIFGGSIGDRARTVSGQISYEQRFGPRNQVEILAPFGWSRIETTGTNGASNWVSSLGDAAVAVKRALYFSLERSSILSGGAEVSLPTGERATGFGKGTFVFEPFILYGQGLPASFFFQGQAGVELPFRTSKAENEAYLRLALGRSFIQNRWGRVWSPLVELLAARELASGSHTIWDIAPQVNITLNKRRSVMFNFGARFPLNDTAGRHAEFLASVIWDWFDGGFFEGW